MNLVVITCGALSAGSADERTGSHSRPSRPFLTAFNSCRLHRPGSLIFSRVQARQQPRDHFAYRLKSFVFAASFHGQQQTMEGIANVRNGIGEIRNV
jgi:hypothetical protein